MNIKGIASKSVKPFKVATVKVVDVSKAGVTAVTDQANLVRDARLVKKTMTEDEKAMLDTAKAINKAMVSARADRIRAEKQAAKEAEKSNPGGKAWQEQIDAVLANA